MQWRIIPLMWVFVGLAQFNRVSMGVAGTEIIRSGLVSETEMGFVYSAFLLLYTICMVPGGWLIDWLGPRTAWILVGFGSVVGLVLTGVAGLVCTSGSALLTSLLVIRALMGASNAPLHPCGARLVANWVPPSSVAFNNGAINCAALIGITLQYPLFGRLMDDNGWPGAYFIMSGVTAAVAMLWVMTAADYPPASVTQQIRQRKPQSHSPAKVLADTLQLLRNRSLVCLTISYGMVGYFQYLLFYWAKDYFEDVRKQSTEDSRLSSALLTLMMGAGMAGGGWLSDRAAARLGQRIGRAVVPIGGVLLCATFIAIGVFAQDDSVILACFAVAAAAAGLGEGAFWSVAVRVGGARGGTAAAILNTGGNGIGMLAPVITPWVKGRYGWDAALLVASVICLLSATMWLGVRLKESTDEPAPSE